MLALNSIPVEYMDRSQRILTEILDKRSKLGGTFREYIARETASEIFDVIDKLYEKDPSSWKGIKGKGFRKLKGKYAKPKISNDISTDSY